MNAPADRDILTNAVSFGRRLKRIQVMRDRRERERSLKRLLDLFAAEEVHHLGALVGYRLPNGQWFCRKLAYCSEEQANTALRGARRSFAGHVRSTYCCPQCGKWHLSDRPRSDSTKC